MRIDVQFSAQMKVAAQTASCQYDVPQGTNVGELLRHIAATGPDALRALLLDQQGAIQPTLLLFVGDELAPHDRALADQQTVAIMTPMSGG